MTEEKFEYLQKAGIGGENILAFAQRHSDGLINCPANFEDFNDAEDIIEVVRRLGLDAEKFWNLVLFAYDYSSDMCTNGIDEEEGGHEMMWKLIERGRKIINKDKVEPLRVDASCTFKLQGRNYKVKSTDSIAVLLYWIHRGMIMAQETDPIWELNWLIDDYDMHLTQRTESQSVAIWCFAAILKKFFSNNKELSARSRGTSEVSLNKLLLISRLVYLAGMSDNDNFLYSDDTIKGFMRQYKNFKISTRGKYYRGINI